IEHWTAPNRYAHAREAKVETPARPHNSTRAREGSWKREANSRCWARLNATVDTMLAVSATYVALDGRPIPRVRAGGKRHQTSARHGHLTGTSSAAADGSELCYVISPFYFAISISTRIADKLTSAGITPVSV